jgi:hydrogenase expression/formation protein HypC
MCVALPGRIISLEGNNGMVDFNGNTARVNLGLVKAEVGDYVLVHAGCALEVMRRDLAEDLLSLFAEVENAR